MTPLVIDRLKTFVPALSGRVMGAADLAALMKVDAVPRVTPCAHVIPSGLVARPRPAAAAGAYVQSFDRGISVVLSLRVHDPEGARALDEIDALVSEIVLALAGWRPTANSVGAFVFRRAVLSSFARGTAVYDISFTLQDQLRIAT